MQVVLRASCGLHVESKRVLVAVTRLLWSCVTTRIRTQQANKWILKCNQLLSSGLCWIMFSAVHVHAHNSKVTSKKSELQQTANRQAVCSRTMTDSTWNPQQAVGARCWTDNKHKLVIACRGWAKSKLGYIFIFFCRLLSFLMFWFKRTNAFNGFAAIITFRFNIWLTGTLPDSWLTSTCKNYYWSNKN